MGGKFSWDIVPLWNKMAHILALFHMPVFIMISGFLFSYIQKNGGYASFTTYILKKIKRVLVPYIIWGLFVCFLMKDNVSNLLQGYSHLWFLMFIFEAYISRCSKLIAYMNLIKRLCFQMPLRPLLARIPGSHRSCSRLHSLFGAEHTGQNMA